MEMTVAARVASLVTRALLSRDPSHRSVPHLQLTRRVRPIGWSGDVEVAAERFAHHVARGRVIVGGSRFDRCAKVRIKSDRNHIGRLAGEWWASATAWFERVDVDVTGDLVVQGFDVGVAE